MKEPIFCCALFFYSFLSWEHLFSSQKIQPVFGSDKLHELLSQKGDITNQLPPETYVCCANNEFFKISLLNVFCWKYCMTQNNKEVLWKLKLIKKTVFIYFFVKENQVVFIFDWNHRRLSPFHFLWEFVLQFKFAIQIKYQGAKIAKLP